jgi:hypothetical protein
MCGCRQNDARRHDPISITNFCAFPGDKDIEQGAIRPFVGQHGGSDVQHVLFSATSHHMALLLLGQQ